ncbi:hypothetical protein HYT92_01545 [Candidatus Pacearchaeota archaeon]|nr:hypothetical protein [Candidatus Pacearchaeota archaeon]
MKYLTAYGSALLGIVITILIKSRISEVKPTLESIILAGIMITAIWLIAEGWRGYIIKKPEEKKAGG